MKKNFTIYLFLIVIASTLKLNAQTCSAGTAPNLVLKNPTYITGTGTGAGTLNAQYRFSNVTNAAPATTDVIVTITSLVNATLTNIDDDVSNPGTANNFQPVVTTNANSEGYVLFDFKFVVSGTTTTYNQTCINFTAVDIDGAAGLQEKVTVYDVTQGNLSTATNLVISKNGNATSIIANNVGCNGICTNPENVCNFGKVNSTNIVFSFGSINNTNAPYVRYGSFQFSPYTQPLALTLPLHFGAVNLTTSNTIASIIWNTNNEIDLQKFVVERSFDGIHFETLKIVAPKNLNTNNSYQYNDDVATLSNKVYYRIKAVDFTGKEYYSAILKAQFVNNSNKMMVYPSPAKNNAFISYTSNVNAIGEYKIINASGITISKNIMSIKKGLNVFPINNVENLSSGTYIVVIVSNNSVLATSKLIK